MSVIRGRFSKILNNVPTIRHSMIYYLTSELQILNTNGMIDIRQRRGEEQSNILKYGGQSAFGNL